MYVCMYVKFCLATHCHTDYHLYPFYFVLFKFKDLVVARGNIQQISYIPQIKQHLPFGLMLHRVGNYHVYVCMYLCWMLLSNKNFELK